MSRGSTLDINEVLALDRFRVDNKFNISPKHLPLKPSNLLKSDINLLDPHKDDNTVDVEDCDDDADSLKTDDDDNDSSSSHSSSDEGNTELGDFSPPDYSQVDTSASENN